jgi:hypothetical protein
VKIDNFSFGPVTLLLAKKLKITNVLLRIAYRLSLPKSLPQLHPNSTEQRTTSAFPIITTRIRPPCCLIIRTQCDFIYITSVGACKCGQIPFFRAHNQAVKLTACFTRAEKVCWFRYEKHTGEERRAARSQETGNVAAYCRDWTKALYGKGYEGTTLEAIAASSGIARRTFSTTTSRKTRF